MEPWRAMDTHNGGGEGVDAYNGGVDGRRRSQWRRGGIKWNPGRCVDQWWSQIRITLKSRILIRIKVKRWILVFIN